MSVDRKPPRIPESRPPLAPPWYARVPPENELLDQAEEIALNRKIVERCKERGASNEQVPAVVDEVVRELYGGWTAKARNHVRSLERQSGDDLGITAARSSKPRTVRRRRDGRLNLPRRRRTMA